MNTASTFPAEDLSSIITGTCRSNTADRIAHLETPNPLWTYFQARTMQRARRESMERLLSQRVYLAVEDYSNALAQSTLRMFPNQSF